MYIETTDDDIGPTPSGVACIETTGDDICTPSGSLSGNLFSQRELCVLCVSAVKFLRKINHRRAAGFAEGHAELFSRQTPVRRAFK